MLGVVALASWPYLYRLSWDFWIERWRVPGRTLVLFLGHSLPLVFIWQVVCAVLQELFHNRARRAVLLGGHVAFVAFLFADSLSVVLAEEHLWSPAHFRLVFLEGGLFGTTLFTAPVAAALLLGVAALALALDWLQGQTLPRLLPSVALLGLSLTALFAVDLTWVRAKIPARPLYLTAVGSTPLPWFERLVRGRRLDEIAVAARTRPQHYPLNGLRPLRHAMAATALPTPNEASAMARPDRIVFVILDGWRYDHWSAEMSPFLHGLGMAGAALTNHYTSVAVTDLSMYSIFSASCRAKVGCVPESVSHSPLSVAALVPYALGALPPVSAFASRNGHAPTSASFLAKPGGVSSSGRGGGERKPAWPCTEPV